MGGSNQPGKWSDWVAGDCRSGCTQGSLGYQEKTRHCEQSRIIHTVDGCKGPATTIDFCDDRAICTTRKDLERSLLLHVFVVTSELSVQVRHGQVQNFLQVRLLHQPGGEGGPGRTEL